MKNDPSAYNAFILPTERILGQLADRCKMNGITVFEVTHANGKIDLQGHEWKGGGEFSKHLDLARRVINDQKFLDRIVYMMPLLNSSDEHFFAMLKSADGRC